jgi:hypothetical protein
MVDDEDIILLVNVTKALDFGFLFLLKLKTEKFLEKLAAWKS